MAGVLKSHIYGLTDPGQVRQSNEDAVRWDEAGGWVLLADGMGGHLAGEVASRLAIETLAEHLAGSHGEAPAAVPGMLDAAVAEANARIHRQARADVRCQNMGTTLVVGLFLDDTLIAAHVGDSRLYRYRDGMLQQLSHDHSLVQELVDEGMLSPAQAAESQYRNVITRALGLEEQVEVDVQQHRLQAGDLYLFCSDGLSDMLGDEELARLLPGEELAPLAQRLVDEANARGGKDNISVILARVG